jgi:hypothetical protein
VPLTLVERTAVAVAMHHLRGRASDIALACTLPFLALELGVRSVGRGRGARRRPIEVSLTSV